MSNTSSGSARHLADVVMRNMQHPRAPGCIVRSRPPKSLRSPASRPCPPSSSIQDATRSSTSSSQTQGPASSLLARLIPADHRTGAPAQKKQLCEPSVDARKARSSPLAIRFQPHVAAALQPPLPLSPIIGTANCCPAAASQSDRPPQHHCERLKSTANHAKRQQQSSPEL
ncbi:uncharacterized protein BDZ99DRAFT_524607 [Mytilinidion resinicola]|uniref:Uncharacterized protein n=1 Tax=Mytilinidion resinicola TaxID=574789 RepID=A0A6A6YAC3_9PEZI|nr:uncharacterized protein BDZ99DRAFT_524607 [Mytilinidion resinicola]KAF2805650.1 hypothetical protein BDZ99DRAFT_524607 [Mytilinidion resinicola]